MSKFLITGGAGYIGSGLLDLLDREQNDFQEIIIYDNLSRKSYNTFFTSKNQKEKIKFVKGDILDSRKLSKVLEGVDVVLHLAAHVTTPYADSEAHTYEQVNHWGTAEVVNAAEESGVQHFIYMSSFSVYGRGADEAFDEGSFTDPHSFYGISKYRGEEHARRLEGKMKLHILRAANVYGFHPAMRMDSIVNKFMFQSQYNEKLKINGEGEHYRPFIHLNYLCAILNQVLQNEIPAGTYNLAEANYNELGMLEELHELYPNLEFIHQNRHMPMPSAQAKIPLKIEAYLKVKPQSLRENLIAFKAAFGF